MFLELKNIRKTVFTFEHFFWLEDTINGEKIYKFHIDSNRNLITGMDISLNNKIRQ